MEALRGCRVKGLQARGQTPSQGRCSVPNKLLPLCQSLLVCGLLCSEAPMASHVHVLLLIFCLDVEALALDFPLQSCHLAHRLLHIHINGAEQLLHVLQRIPQGLRIDSPGLQRLQLGCCLLGQLLSAHTANLALLRQYPLPRQGVIQRCQCCDLLRDLLVQVAHLLLPIQNFLLSPLYLCLELCGSVAVRAGVVQHLPLHLDLLGLL
mmetsp:Transcript_1432/g.3453  ORF Transcript_1432/g.3453 Transcript_1432/m.3453 type:complete len:208 (-) Transcript_1432:267-890(-)